MLQQSKDSEKSCCFVNTHGSMYDPSIREIENLGQCRQQFLIIRLSIWGSERQEETQGTFQPPGITTNQQKMLQIIQQSQKNPKTLVIFGTVIEFM